MNPAGLLRPLRAKEAHKPALLGQAGHLCRCAPGLKVDGSGNVTGFFSQQFGSGDYTAFTTTPEGHVQLGGKDILPAKAYPYGIKAEVKSLTYDGGSSLFTVRLSVKDSENKNTLAETTFEVEKLNVTTEDTAEGRARAEDIRNTEN